MNADVNATEILLGIVIPVKSIDSQAQEALALVADRFPQVEVLAVGQLSASRSILPSNLQIIDSVCSIYEAMNKGVLLSNAKYLLFMGIDDTLIADSVLPIIETLARIEASLVVLPFMVGARRVDQQASSRTESFHHQGMLFRRSTILELKGYRTDYLLHSDLDLMYRIQKTGTVANISIPLVVFSKGGATTSGRNAWRSISEINRIYRANDVTRFSKNFVFSIALLVLYRVKWVLSQVSRLLFR